MHACATLPLLQHVSGTFARFLRCQRPLLLSDGQVKERQVAFETTHPVLLLPSQVTLAPRPVPQKSFVRVVSRYPYEPSTPRKVLSAFARVVSTFSQPVLASASPYEGIYIIAVAVFSVPSDAAQEQSVARLYGPRDRLLLAGVLVALP